jgi:hypothetical protein
MRISSSLVALTSAAALVAGSIGMASAQPHAAHTAQEHAAHGHAVHGHAGENRALAPASARQTKKLVGIVNSDRDIEISDRTPRHGRYKLVVRDSTMSHNWHLYGNGKGTLASTSVRKTGKWVFHIRLTAGSYRVVCDPHFDDMEFDLIVH